MEPHVGSTPPIQKCMGPAPFASFEDLSDEMVSPLDEKGPPNSLVRLPGITEQDSTSPTDPRSRIHSLGISLIGSSSRDTHSSSQSSTYHSPLLNKIKIQNTPRIDISRASSSSHHDSRDSTPDREICDSTEENNLKLGLGFKEDGALDLRLSTEELDFHESCENKKYKSRNQTPSPEPDDLCINRKDSQCSDVLLLSISGRTSRLSSIGSQGSAKSRLSNASHFSITSGQSAYSQCSSPHKTILETSFCGYRLTDSCVARDHTELKGDSEELEKVLLSRQSNLTEAVLVEGLENQGSLEIPSEQISRIGKNTLDINDLKDSYNKERYEKNKIPKKIIAKSGVEYIYIPLKGPLPGDDEEEKFQKRSFRGMKDEQNRKPSQKSSNQYNTKKSLNTKEAKQNASQINLPTTENSQPKYIRIKLKPDQYYHDELKEPVNYMRKPTCLDLTLNGDKPSPPKTHFEYHMTSGLEQKQAKSLTNTPSVSPKLIRRSSKGSSTPSPSVPRRNSFASMLRPGSESPGSSIQKRKNTLSNIIKNTNTCSKVGSKSIDRNKFLFLPVSSSNESVDSKGKASSVLSIFKTNTREKCSKKNCTGSQELRSKSKLHDNLKEKKNIEKNREPPLSSESIRIPLHSPTYYSNKSLGEKENEESQAEISEISTEKKNPEDEIKSLKSEELSYNMESRKNGEIISTTIVNSNSSVEKKDLLCERKYNVPLGNISNNVVLSSSIQILPDNEDSLNKLNASDDTSTLCQCTPNSENELIDNIPNKYKASILDTIKPEAVKCNVANGEDHYSSESERDTDIDYSKSCNIQNFKILDSLEIERKAIVLQQDSFEDELPYVPTTLPLERSAAVPILPVKQRCVMEVKTYPIERPRSTTPIYSSGLENYIDGFINKSEFKENKPIKTSEKLKISLPRTDSSNKTQIQVIQTSSNLTENINTKDETPPPLPPKGIQKTWINFEELPERRKPPKRIQTIPSRGHIDISGLVLKDNVVYTYVNPEECKCECHEHKEHRTDNNKEPTQEEELPLLDIENNEENSGR